MTIFFISGLAILAAFTYVAAVLSTKRAAELGTSLWHSTVAANLFTALFFQGLLVFGGHWQPMRDWWQPLAVAVLFITGQIWTFFSLQKGDVSIATPVLGLKILLVAGFATLLTGQRLVWQIWVAAVLCTIGIAFLNRAPNRKNSAEGGAIAATIISAGLAAASFALVDVLIQKWSPVWGMGRFLPLTMGTMGVLSLGLLTLFPVPLRELTPPARKWMWRGGILMALQSLIFVFGIAYFKQATVSNVVYSSRGVWSIAAALLFGHYFHSAEQNLDKATLRGRFIGASLMFAAIVLVLLRR